MAANDTPGAPWRRRLVGIGAAVVILAAVAAGVLTGRGPLLTRGGNDLVPSAYPLLVSEVQNFLLYRGANPAPDVIFVDGRRNERTLAEFRGRYVLLNFWANWCVPCREEMPSLDRLQQRLGSERFHVLALSQDLGGLSAVADFFIEHELEHLAQYADATARTQFAFDVPGLPTTFLIDPEGRIVGRMVGPAEWDFAGGHGADPALRRRGRDLPRRRGRICGVVEKAAPALAPKSPGLDVLHQQRAGTVFGIVQCLVQHFEVAEADVEADEVREFQRSHGVVRAEAQAESMASTVPTPS